MTIDELIGLLEELRDDISGDAEVRLMTQENWPFENSIRGVTTSSELVTDDEDDEYEDDGEEFAYIVEGRQICYGSKNAWNVCHR